MSCVRFFVCFLDKVVKLVGGGSVINGAFTVYFPLKTIVFFAIQNLRKSKVNEKRYQSIFKTFELPLKFTNNSTKIL